MSEQSQTAFENFLEPIAHEISVRDLKISSINRSQQRGLLPAIKTVFKGIPHGYCHAHYLNNLAKPIADADEKMKVTLRQRVREEVGELIRQEKKENRGVLTVTGLIPSPVNSELNSEQQEELSEKPSEKRFEQADVPCQNQTVELESLSHQDKVDSPQNLNDRDASLFFEATEFVTEEFTTQSAIQKLIEENKEINKEINIANKNNSFLASEACEFVTEEFTTQSAIQKLTEENKEINKEINIANKNNSSLASEAGKNHKSCIHSIETVNHEQQSEDTHTTECVLNPLYTMTRQQEEVIEALTLAHTLFINPERKGTVKPSWFRNV